MGQHDDPQESHEDSKTHILSDFDSVNVPKPSHWTPNTTEQNTGKLTASRHHLTSTTEAPKSSRWRLKRSSFIWFKFDQTVSISDGIHQKNVLKNMNEPSELPSLPANGLIIDQSPHKNVGNEMYWLKHWCLFRDLRGTWRNRAQIIFAEKSKRGTI